MFVISGIYLFMAILFTIKKDYHDRFFNFVNPKYKNLTNQKGDNFKSKNKKTNIVSYYILSGLMFINGLINIDNNSNHYIQPNPIKYFLKIGIIVLVFSIIIYFVNNFFIKKSKDHGEYMVWTILFSIVVTIVMISSLTLFILS